MGKIVTSGSPAHQCPYCQRTIGEEHAFTCVATTRKVILKVSFIIEVEAPISWNKEKIEFYYNESSHCADNFLDKLQEIADIEGCLCNVTTTEYMGDAPIVP